MKVGLVVKHNVPEAIGVLERLHDIAPDETYLVEASEVRRNWPFSVSGRSRADFEQDVDLVVVCGGDGTLIHAASLLPSRTVPILGVNLGTIGFLTDVARDEIEKAFPLALRGELPFVDRLRLDAALHRSGRPTERARVLNDAVAAKSAIARIATYEVRLGGELVTTMRADGVIVATPTGSTAYSMAANGSILSPGLRAVAVTPICPHGLTQRPVVVSPDVELRVQLVTESPVMATFDGQTAYEMKAGDEIALIRADVPTRLFTVPWRSYFDTLRAKLRWGEG